MIDAICCGAFDDHDGKYHLSSDDLNRVTQKQVNGLASGLAPEVTVNSYDDTASNGHGGYFNTGKLTDATRSVAAQTVSGIAFEAVNVVQRFDYDLAGRLKRERHGNVAGAERTLAYEYYPTGELKRKQMADGAWTGAHSYDAMTWPSPTMPMTTPRL